ncbi:hypothetical protein [Nocardiopsis aegyptia]|uniref:Uncharacterized protein n=1 Tax=Nocardiopsis aegyptia TaxID=220378 RepID=A0A7Z0EK97_9ACTN|nr:hypothetical protein [Nocardiopsis aegyptia]NYJ32833.1 hypothetical protein [Nocardiopsis aegyptia]
MPHDKLKDAARALAAREGLSYVDARRRLAVIDHHFQQHIEVDAHTTLLRVSDVADRVAAEGRLNRLLLGLTWGEGSLWADLPAQGGHVGVVESGFAGSRALCRHLALQARAHGADLHLLAPGAGAAYPGMNAVEDPEECRRRLADLAAAVPTAQRPVFVVIDNPHALGEDTPSRGAAHTRIHRLLTRAPEHLHVVLRCDRPAQAWPVEAFAVVAVTGVLASTWRAVVGEPISEAATSGPDMWTFLPGPHHQGQGVLDCALDPGSERVVAFVPGAPNVPTRAPRATPRTGRPQKGTGRAMPGCGSAQPWTATPPRPAGRGSRPGRCCACTRPGRPVTPSAPPGGPPITCAAPTGSPRSRCRSWRS